ncbi:MAG: DUF1553 domain-containing protein, partial [Gemmataceae bacterium]
PKTYLLRRGDVTKKGPELAPGFVRVALPEKVTPSPKSRIELVDWLTAPEHPLTSRVIVNRLWQRYFQHGIVRTPNDFGTRGEAPTHPELLDWLALELMHPSAPSARPWSLKRLHKMIVMSATYRQMAAPADRRDATNKLLSRQNRKRLDAEALRDTVLAVSGQLNRAVGGPSIRTPLEPEVYDLIFTEDEPTGLWPVHPDPREHVRRSIYLFGKRNVRLPLLEAFDLPDRLSSCAERGNSTFAPQALILVNGPFLRTAAAHWVNTQSRNSDEQFLTAVVQAFLQRAPSDAERRRLLQFLAEQATAKIDATQARVDLALAILNLNELLYIP